MSPAAFNRVVRRELNTLRRDGVLDEQTYDTLCRRYPVSPWDWLSLGRWLLVFGAISAAAGLVLLGRELFEFTLVKLAWALGIAGAGAFYAGRRLLRRGLTWSARGVELAGGLLLIGLTFTLGVIYASGSGNWPALLLIDLLILLPLAYLLGNVLLLVLTAVVFFTWFGGVTGYLSGWGAYFFGMNYPLRFLLVGVAIALAGVLHRNYEPQLLARWQGWGKVYLSAGIFFAEMALWLLSLFGNFDTITGSYQESATELLLFNLLWGGANLGLLWLGRLTELRMARGYAITFLIIQGYTLYFWHVAGELGAVLGSLLAGLSALGLVSWLEKQRRVNG
jgi:hypothetical protein